MTGGGRTGALEGAALALAGAEAEGIRSSAEAVAATPPADAEGTGATDAAAGEDTGGRSPVAEIRDRNANAAPPTRPTTTSAPAAPSNSVRAEAPAVLGATGATGDVRANDAGGDVW